MNTDNPLNRISRRRGFLFGLMALVIFGGYMLRLFQIQIVEGEEYEALANRTNTVNISLAASRGEILDRNMRPIAVNQTSYNVIFDYNYFPYGSEPEQQKWKNDIILSLTELLSEAEETWNDTLPISRTQPYAFEEGREASVASLKTRIRMSDYATADNCMQELIKQYNLQGYTAEQQRIIAGVRYEMDIRDFSPSNAFVFSGSVSRGTMYKIVENNNELPGVDVQATPVREYVQGDVASHLIGTIGPIYAEEYAELKEKGYALNDTVGKSGIESAMEDALRGTTGTRTLVKDAQGNILEESVTEEPVPGSSVVLTLDTELQAAAQQAIDDVIQELRKLPDSNKNDGHDVKSGSAVVLDVRDGGVLACATWPNYDLSTYSQDYNELVNDPDKPLFNRATHGIYTFGSTVKPLVAFAGLMTGKLTPSETVYCDRIYDYYQDYQPRCMDYHGTTNMVRALEKSCNYYFYEAGRRLGATTINEYAALFGLGQKTGIETGEATGYLDGPEYRTAHGLEPWVGGDNLRAGIGQTSYVTPLQLATYAMTIANKGVRYKTHLVHSVRSYDGTIESVVEPEILAKADLSEEAIQTVHEGMVKVVQSGTGARYFRGASYDLAAKTGTAQTGSDTNPQSDHSVFIGYAPAENPEVAIAVMLENGANSAGNIARKILDAYFEGKSEGLAPTPPNVLLP